MEQTQIQKLHERVQALEEQDGNRHAVTAPEATPPSQRRSSVASTELLQPEHALTAPASYPVDAIMESQIATLWRNGRTSKSRRLLALFYLLNPAQPTTAGRFQKDMLG